MKFSIKIVEKIYFYYIATQNENNFHIFLSSENRYIMLLLSEDDHSFKCLVGIINSI